MAIAAAETGRAPPLPLLVSPLAVALPLPSIAVRVRLHDVGQPESKEDEAQTVPRFASATGIAILRAPTIPHVPALEKVPLRPTQEQVRAREVQQQPRVKERPAQEQVRARPVLVRVRAQPSQVQMRERPTLVHGRARPMQVQVRL